jgi:hypothetical protein
MAPIRAFTNPGLLSMAPLLAFNVQEEPPLLHDELPCPGLRPWELQTSQPKLKNKNSKSRCCCMMPPDYMLYKLYLGSLILTFMVGW